MQCTQLSRIFVTDIQVYQVKHFHRQQLLLITISEQQKVQFMQVSYLMQHQVFSQHFSMISGLGVQSAIMISFGGTVILITQYSPLLSMNNVSTLTKIFPLINMVL